MPLFETPDPALPQRRRARQVHAAEWTIWALTAAALVVGHGIPRFNDQLSRELGLLAFATMALMSAGIVFRYWVVLDRDEFRQQYGPSLGVQAVWLVGLPIVALFGFPGLATESSSLLAVLAWSELMFWLRTVAGAIRLVRKIAAARGNPAFVFVASFALLIAVGTLLLLLPASRVQVAGATTEAGAPLLVALFTATSATCVTGLSVVDTGTYWTRTGQLVILGLIQIGGLGVMTFGAFFALGQRRGFLLRESVFLGKLLEADDRLALKRLLLSILGFTAVSELCGALAMMSAAPAGPWHERAFFGVFHAINAYCNAGFSTLPANLEGLGGKWQIWGVMAGLIVIGGLGFETLRSVFAVLTWPVASRWPWRDPARELRAPRLTATARLSAIATFVLLLVGTVAFFVLEADGVLKNRPPSERVANAWFQSVTFRTAGFNTVSFANLYPSTRLIGIVLMFIGGSPGSTAGGVKTVVFALMILATAGTIRGRERIDIAGRSIPDGFVRRGAAVMTLATGALFTSTLLVTIFEQQPELFLHHLFETTSALGTVGLTTIGTANLRPPSQLVLVATMFIGRVGPLTLLVALASQRRELKYEYPTERVALG